MVSRDQVYLAYTRRAPTATSFRGMCLTGCLLLKDADADKNAVAAANAKAHLNAGTSVVVPASVEFLAALRE